MEIGPVPFTTSYSRSGRGYCRRGWLLDSSESPVTDKCQQTPSVTTQPDAPTDTPRRDDNERDRQAALLPHVHHPDTQTHRHTHTHTHTHAHTHTHRNTLKTAHDKTRSGADLNADNLWISRAYLQISDHCRVTVRDRLRVRVTVRNMGLYSQKVVNGGR